MMAEIPQNPYAGRSDEWRKGYEAGLSAIQQEMDDANKRGLIITVPAEVERLKSELAAANAHIEFLKEEAYGPEQK